jgi:hypothetical protein
MKQANGTWGKNGRETNQQVPETSTTAVSTSSGVGDWHRTCSCQLRHDISLREQQLSRSERAQLSRSERVQLSEGQRSSTEELRSCRQQQVQGQRQASSGAESGCDGADMNQNGRSSGEPIGKLGEGYMGCLVDWAIALCPLPPYSFFPSFSFSSSYMLLPCRSQIGMGPPRRLEGGISPFLTLLP